GPFWFGPFRSGPFRSGPFRFGLFWGGRRLVPVFGPVPGRLGRLGCGLFRHALVRGRRSGRRQGRPRHGLQVEVVRRPARARYPAGAAHLLLASPASASVAAHRTRP
ncbi:hypothetical protein, partial [Streptomyces sp. NPDC017520]|uniref:hypothetical protein n=1 Tax=Streptomyces sp. NPDC017520 TaxID=3364998 RepID=UPI0037947FB6